MASFPLIFPSLSRQPSMDSSKSIEDDTIRDPAESGYVATRPRYTRTRRTWKANVRNLVAEDVRVLDEFAMSPSFAARGGNSFLYPNLLPNWSFEFPALISSEIVLGWSKTTVTQMSCSLITSGAQDGNNAIQFSTVNGQAVAGGSDLYAFVQSDTKIPCTPGEVYQINAGVNVVDGETGPGSRIAYATAVFYDASGTEVSEVPVIIVQNPFASGWKNFSGTFNVAGGCASFTIKLQLRINDLAGGGYTLNGGTHASFDQVGCALLTPLSAYGRMVGSQSLGCQVRFSSLPETSDIGWGGGVKVYGAHFELTEV